MAIVSHQSTTKNAIDVNDNWKIITDILRIVLLLTTDNNILDIESEIGWSVLSALCRTNFKKLVLLIIIFIIYANLLIPIIWIAPTSFVKNDDCSENK